ncbi:MAG: anti-sigma factor [Chitinophagia bacterium]|nr:anti-sigma factor [Chitinophagia bacterium]
MDIKAYIESGILDAFVLGALPAGEADRVQADIDQYPELAAEVAALQDAMFAYTSEDLMVPPAALQEKIWNELSTGANARQQIVFEEQNDDAFSGQLNSVPTGNNSKQIPLQASSSRFSWRYAATVAALVGSAGLNVYFWNQSKQQKQQLLAISTTVDSMHQQQKAMEFAANGFKKTTDMMADEGMNTVVMHTMLKGHPMAATLFLSKNKDKAYIMLNALPKPPAGMQYQLWAIHNGKPMNMGVLPNNMAGTPMIEPVSSPTPVMEGEAFAISLEKEGGSITPSVDSIYVMGRPS